MDRYERNAFINTVIHSPEQIDTFKGAQFDVDHKDAFNKSALRYAMDTGHLWIVDKVLEAGASLYDDLITLEDIETSAELVEHMLQRGAIIKPELILSVIAVGKTWCLHSLREKDFIKAVQVATEDNIDQVLDLGYKLRRVDVFATHLRKSSRGTIERFLDAGHVVDQRVDNEYPLSILLSRYDATRQDWILEILPRVLPNDLDKLYTNVIRKAVRLNVIDKVIVRPHIYATIALNYAVRIRRINAIPHLIRMGAWTITALEIAIDYYHKDCVNVLLEEDAQVSARAIVQLCYQSPEYLHRALNRFQGTLAWSGYKVKTTHLTRLHLTRLIERGLRRNKDEDRWLDTAMDLAMSTCPDEQVRQGWCSVIEPFKGAAITNTNIITSDGVKLWVDDLAKYSTLAAQWTMDKECSRFDIPYTHAQLKSKDPFLQLKIANYLGFDNSKIKDNIRQRFSQCKSLDGVRRVLSGYVQG